METTTETNCGKCGGTGIVQVFKHYAGGECFECDGTGLVLAERAYAAGKATSGKRRELTRKEWIMAFSAHLNVMKNDLGDGIAWGRDEMETGFGPKSWAHCIETCPHADVIARAKAAALRLGVR